METAHYPTHIRVMVGYGLALLGLAATLGLLFPPAIGPAPNPEIEITKPPIIFYWMYAFEDWFKIQGIFYAGLFIFGFLMLLPFIDRSAWRSLRRRPVFALLGVALLIAITVLTLMVAFGPTVSHMGG